jgi:hypothetical protein
MNTQKHEKYPTTRMKEASKTEFTPSIQKLASSVKNFPSIHRESWNIVWYVRESKREIKPFEILLASRAEG